jgi:CheY-like chemotaxis protein
MGHTELIIGLTGNALDDDVAAFVTSGADCVLSKPMREKDLDMVLHFIQQHGTQSTAENRKTLQTLVAAKQRGSFHL